MSILGGVCGVATGCILGMGVLLFMDTGAAGRKKQKAQTDVRLQKLLEKATDSLGAKRTTVYLISKKGDSLRPRCSTSPVGDLRRIKMDGVDPLAFAVSQNRVVNVASLKDSTFSDMKSRRGGPATSVLIVPIRDPNSGDVVGAVQAQDRANGRPFDQLDEKFLDLLAYNLSLDLNHTNRE